jgi:hypothetical protein
VVVVNIEQRKDVRFHFLSLLYKLTGGKEFKFLDYKVVGTQLGLDERASFKIAQYLAEEGLLRFRSESGLLTITHGGITEVQDSLSSLGETSFHFASPEVAATVQDDVQQVPAPSVAATWISGFSVAQTAELREIIRLVRASMGGLNLQRQEEENMDADIRTIEAQLSSSRPRKTILVEALDSMRGILESATDGAPMPLLLRKMGALSGATSVIEAQ